MTLDDLLDTLRRDILHDRSDQVAGDSDRLWSDTTLVRYIDAAHRRFARRSLCIRDSSSPVTRFVTVPYQGTYALDPSIISVLSMRSLGNGQWVNGTYLAGAYSTTNQAFISSGAVAIHGDTGDLVRTSHANRRRYRGDDNLPWDVNALDTLQPGKPLTFDTDESMSESAGSAGVVNVTLYPAPRADLAGCTMQMRVVRMPLVRLTPQNLQVIPEVPEDYHLDMLDWAAYLALRIVDHEAGDPARAAEFQQSFERHCEEARLEILRKTFAPQRWGFGGNGFSFHGN